jgi:hypothetical protein
MENILVDDGLNLALDVSVLSSWAKVYSISDDIPWNQPVGKNLGAS